MMTEITEKLNDADHGRAVMGNSVVSWIGFNLVMLVLYLGFFYMCLAVEYPRSLVFGLVIAGVMTLLCFGCHRWFTNRYEFGFYWCCHWTWSWRASLPSIRGIRFTGVLWVFGRFLFCIEFATCCVAGPMPVRVSR